MKKKKTRRNQKTRNKAANTKNCGPFHMRFNVDPLKLAYVMVAADLYYNCELVWMNPDPRSLDVRYVFPRDLTLGETVTESNIGTFDDLSRKHQELGCCPFICTCALVEDDTERVNLIYLSEDTKEAHVSFYLSKNHRDPKNTASIYADLLECEYDFMFGQV